MGDPGALFCGVSTPARPDGLASSSLFNDRHAGIHSRTALKCARDKRQAQGRAEAELS
jgi:hypothetical protein